MFPTAADLWSQRLRHRSWQRVLQFAPVRGVFGLILLWLGTAAATMFAMNGALAMAWRAVAAVVSIALLCGGLAAFAWLVEGRPPRELGVRGAVVEWLGGFASGALLLAASVGVLVAIGEYSITGGDGPGALVTGIVLFAPQSLVEELAVRAVVFKIAEESLGTWAAIVGQALLFGGMHLGNPHATIISAIAIALEAGTMLAGAYMYTRRIWLAWGIHFAWNFTQGTVFGVRVSGLSVARSLLHATPRGHAWLNGGDFGVEASPVAVVVCVGAAVALLLAAAKRGQIVPLRAQRERVKSLRAV